MSFVLLAVMWRKKGMRDFPMLGAFAALHFLHSATVIPVLFFRAQLDISKRAAYNVFFYAYWPATFLQTVLMVLLVYGIYSLALEPFEPLKKLGTIIFRWIAAISVAVSLGVAVGPHMIGTSQFANMLGQMQQTASVLTLCLLLFVCFALKPLGLTYASRAFGATLGLGMLATIMLAESAWFTHQEAIALYGKVSFYGSFGTCLTFLVWTVYFAKPEPERAMVLLPTTSPYFFWNKISEALGDSPGFVAISGFTPDSMAPGELAAFSAINKPQPGIVPATVIPLPIAVNQR